MSNENDLYRSLFETASEAILVMRNGQSDSAWVCVDCNASAANLFGSHKKDLLGKNILDFSPETQVGGGESGQLWQERTTAVLSGKPQRFEWLYQPASGETLQAEIALNAVAYGDETYVQASLRSLEAYKQTEAVSRNNEARLRTFINTLPDIAFVVDKEGRYLDVLVAEDNPRYAEAVAKLTGRLMQDVMPPNKAKVLLTAIRDVIEHQKPQTLEYSLQDPPEIWYEGRILPVEAEQPDIKTVLLVARDITERKQTEEELRRLSLAVDQSANTIVITDTRGYIEYVNPKFTETTGYSREEAIGQHTRILKSGQMPPEKYRELWATISAGHEWRGEFQNRKQNGQLYWELASISPIKNEAGNITHFLAVKEEITDRKRAEEALRESEARYSAVVEQSNDGIIIIQDNLCKFVNQTLADMLGYVAEEVENTPVINYIAPESRAMVAGRIKARLAGEGAPSVYEANLMKKDGTIFEAELSAGVIQYRGEIADVGVIRDISERKRANEELRQYRDQLEELVEARTGELEDRVRELNELQRLMSREGWQEFQATRKQVAPGYLFDQASVRPVELAELSIAANGQPQEVSSSDLPTSKTDGAKAVTKPLTVSGESIGTLGIFDSDPDNRLSPEDQMFLDEVATQVAEALERARLLEQSQAALAETETLFLAGSRINEAGDLQEIVAAVMEAGSIPAVNRAILYAFEQDSTGEVETMTVVANWYSGQGTEPIAIGTRYSKTMLTAFDLLLSPEPRFFDDSQHDERIDPATLAVLQRLNARALAVMPLWVGSRQVGSLLLEGEDVHRFSDQDIRLMLSLTDQAAVAVDNQRLFAETHQALAEVEATQRRYTLQSWEVYRARKAAMSYEQDREGVPPLGKELPAEVGQAVSQKKPLAISAAQDLPAGAERDHPLSTEAKSSLVVPLTVRDEIIGVLGLQETAETRAWTSEEIALVQAIAEQVAQAAEQIRLFDETQQRAAREQRVGEIGDKIRATQSLEEALQVAIKEVGLSLKAPQTTVQLEVN